MRFSLSNTWESVKVGAIFIFSAFQLSFRWCLFEFESFLLWMALRRRVILYCVLFQWKFRQTFLWKSNEKVGTKSTGREKKIWMTPDDIIWTQVWITINDIFYSVWYFFCLCVPDAQMGYRAPSLPTIRCSNYAWLSCSWSRSLPQHHAATFLSTGLHHVALRPQADDHHRAKNS